MPGSGRVKGTPNRLTRDGRVLIHEIMEGIGGAPYIVSMIKSNPDRFLAPFLALYGRTVPTALQVEGVTLAQLVAGSWADIDRKTIDVEASPSVKALPGSSNGTK